MSRRIIDNETSADLGEATAEQVEASKTAPNGIIAIDFGTGAVLQPGQMGYSDARRVWVD